MKNLLLKHFQSKAAFLKLLFRGKHKHTHTHSQRRLLAHGDYSSISTCRRILAIFRYVYVIFAVFHSSYVFVELFLSEPIPMSCGTLFEKHWSKGMQYHTLFTALEWRHFTHAIFDATYHNFSLLPAPSSFRSRYRRKLITFTYFLEWH